MNAKEMFEASKRNDYNGLPKTIYNVLKRYHIHIKYTYEAGERRVELSGIFINNDGTVNKGAVKKAVLSGDIYVVTGIGEKYAMKICEWLEAQEYEFGIIDTGGENANQ